MPKDNQNDNRNTRQDKSGNQSINRDNQGGGQNPKKQSGRNNTSN